jgi:glycosyltransferase involved in cell wall biosynthesis
MFSLLRSTLGDRIDFDLLDAGGARVGHMELEADGVARVRPDPYGLSGSWRRDGQVVRLTDGQGRVVANFDSEGLDGQGRKLIWGRLKIGSHWIEHCLRQTQQAKPKISFCVTSRNRLHHMQQTFIRNIEDNRDYPDLEFVLLDYNSSDGLSDWVKSELSGEIAAGRLNYYWTSQPTYFHPTHARNMSIRLARGDIVCVVDADNFTGRGFASYIADNVQPDTFLVGCRMIGERFEPLWDEGCVGRFAIYKSTFLDVGGMDEEHVGWGYDDLDLYERLRAKGYRCQSIDPRYTKCIAHDDSERRKELREQHIGRDSTTGEGSVWVNARRSERNLKANRIVLNDGRIGCGGVVRNLGQDAQVVRERRLPRISVCIAVGEQSEEIRRSLPDNLHSTRHYPHMEFVVLDRPGGSMGKWLRENLASEMSAGRVVHSELSLPFPSCGPDSTVHHRNMAARLAGGEVLCLVSPEQKLPANFTSEILRKFHEGWICEPLDEAGAILSKHLFYLEEGLDQGLDRSHAIGDLLERTRRRLSAASKGNISRSGLETRDFGGGTAIRNGEHVIVSPHRFPRVTLTTMCMNRLYHLKQTLPKNLADNLDYPNLEYLLLNYGDQDGLDEWVRTEMKEHIDSGRLVYHRSPEQHRFHCAHAKNMATRLATGELICNVDADNITGHHFAFHVAERLQTYDFLVGCLYPNEELDSYCDQGMAGRSAVRRAAFYDAGGFDEAMIGWGHDDLDFYARLKGLGYKGAPIDGRFLHCIAHGDAERAAHTGVEDIGGVMNPDRGTARENRERSDRNVAEGKLTLNDGNVGCGTAYEKFGAHPITLAKTVFNKISICVTSMNRLHHLAQTLPQNLADNRSYPNLEIVLLDYNSSDGLEGWARAHLGDWIEAGRLVYFKTTEPAHFKRSHARNLAIRLASGDIVCTVDADNFTGRGFAHYVNERFNRYSGIYLRPDFDGTHIRLRDAFGRICMRRDDFLKVEGYDERLVEYGYEDVDLCARLEKLPLKATFIEDDRFLRYISHSNIERVGNGPILSQVAELLRGKERDQKDESLLYLLRDNSFLWLGFRVDGLSMQGQWTQQDGQLRLVCEQGVTASLEIEKSGGSYTIARSASKLRLQPSNDIEFSSNVILEHVIQRNEQRHLGNLGLADYRVNAGSFGEAKVSRNFGPEKLEVERASGELGKRP